MTKEKKSTLKRAKSTVKLTTVALALGGMIGAIIGLLKAPKKGIDLQNDLEKEGKKLKRFWKNLLKK